MNNVAEQGCACWLLTADNRLRPFVGVVGTLRPVVGVVGMLIGEAHSGRASLKILSAQAKI